MLLGSMLGIFLAGALYAVAQKGHHPKILLLDPAQLTKSPWYIGFFSNLGVFAMVSAAVICLFASRHAHRDQRLLLAIGAFTLYIAVDDFLMLHERVLPNMVGIPQLAVLAAIGLAALAIGWSFWRDLIGRENGALWLAFVLLGASVAVDDLIAQAWVLEDSLKFIGLCIWTVYWISRAQCAMRSASIGR
jgi:hypothetical protein